MCAINVKIGDGTAPGLRDQDFISVGGAIIFIETQRVDVDMVCLVRIKVVQKQHAITIRMANRAMFEINRHIRYLSRIYEGESAT